MAALVVGNGKQLRRHRELFTRPDQGRAGRRGDVVAGSLEQRPRSLRAVLVDPDEADDGSEVSGEVGDAPRLPVP